MIFLDNLFTDADPDDETGSAAARERTLRLLESLPEGERVAIYAQGRTLKVICEFTADRDLLIAQMKRWHPSTDTPAGGVPTRPAIAG